MHFPDPLRNSIQQHLGIKIQSANYCAGGDINQAAQLETTDGSLFVKWNPKSPSEMFTTEARGLKLLHEAKTLRIPEVISVHEAQDECPAYLILEWLESGRSTPQTDEQLGEGLATLHLIHAEQHGLDHNNFIGRLPQSNTHHISWAEFYAEQRIRPQMELARPNGQLPTHRERLLSHLINKLPDLLPSENPAASLLHGDLWRGNVMTLANGTPAIIDPAVYYGHREIELAFTELFGGFSSRFYDAYNAIYPINSDYQQRKSLYQLYPMMTHMNLFGGGYGNSVDSIARRYLN